MKKYISYLLTNLFIKSILFCFITFLYFKFMPLTLGIQELLLFILISILSSIITKKVIKLELNRLKQVFYLTLLDNLLSVFILSIALEIYQRFIFVPQITTNYDIKTVETYSEFNVSYTSYINILISLLVINFILFLIEMYLITINKK